MLEEKMAQENVSRKGSSGQIACFLDDLYLLQQKYPSLYKSGFSVSQDKVVMGNPKELVETGVMSFACKVWCSVNGTWFCCLED